MQMNYVYAPMQALDYKRLADMYRDYSKGKLAWYIETPTQVAGLRRQYKLFEILKEGTLKRVGLINAS